MDSFWEDVILLDFRATTPFIVINFNNTNKEYVDIEL